MSYNNPTGVVGKGKVGYAIVGEPDPFTEGSKTEGVQRITKTELMDFPLQRKNAVWTDVNTDYGNDGKPVLLVDVLDINNSIRNLFRCPIGDRGRIFRPDFGTYIYQLLQEPQDAETAGKIRASLIQSLEKWEPRVTLDHSNTGVWAAKQIAGYYVKVAYQYRLTKDYFSTNFLVTP
jgi:phage baseplate assembly protein W